MAPSTKGWRPFGWLASLACCGAVLWPIRVWSGEPLSRRDSHYAMPIDRRLHDLTRVLAGAVWVLVVTTVLTTTAVVTSLLFDHGSQFSRLTPMVLAEPSDRSDLGIHPDLDRLRSGLVSTLGVVVGWCLGSWPVVDRGSECGSRVREALPIIQFSQPDPKPRRTPV